MHWLLTSALLATSTSFAEPIAAQTPLIFHRAVFADEKTVNLSLISNNFSDDAAYDFDVSIRLSKSDKSGAFLYTDTGTHRARVKCSESPAVLVGGIRHIVTSAPDPTKSSDWRDDLWRVVCALPVS